MLSTFPDQLVLQGLSTYAALKCDCSLAGVRAIPEFQRGVLELESGQERFVVLGVCQLSFHVVSSFDDLCRNGFAQVAISERYLHIWIRSRPYDLVGPLGQFGGSYRYIVVEYDVGSVFGGGVCSEWKNGEDEGKGQGSFRHVYLLYLLPLFDSVEKHYVHWKRTAAYSILIIVKLATPSLIHRMAQACLPASLWRADAAGRSVPSDPVLRFRL
jgi:hypothetical protein